ncbi:MAG: hypothetical protein ACFFCE_05745 [Promethearchaeota archaeon]
MFNDIDIGYADLDTYLICQIGYEGTLRRVVVQEIERNYGSIEAFLRKEGYGKYIDNLKQLLMVK